MLTDAEANPVPRSYKSERPPGGGVRRHVLHHCAKDGTAHPGIGYAHHVLDAHTGKLLWDRQLACLRHCSVTSRTSILEHQKVLGRHIHPGSSIREARSSSDVNTMIRCTAPLVQTVAGRPLSAL
jgi:hypothetical protein